MSTLTLGQYPGGLSVILAPGYPFTATITAAKDGAPWLWPDGTVLALVFDTGGSYAGAVSGADVTWTLTAEQCDAIGGRGRAYIDVTYPDTPRFRWVSGRSVRAA